MPGNKTIITTAVILALLVTILAIVSVQFKRSNEPIIANNTTPTITGGHDGGGPRTDPPPYTPYPSHEPTTQHPTNNPTTFPSTSPTNNPTKSITIHPTTSPTTSPTKTPRIFPGVDIIKRKISKNCTVSTFDYTQMEKSTRRKWGELSCNATFTIRIPGDSTFRENCMNKCLNHPKCKSFGKVYRSVGRNYCRGYTCDYGPFKPDGHSCSQFWWFKGCT